MASYFGSCFKGLTPQAQGLLAKGWLSDILLHQPSRLTDMVVRAQLDAWRDIASDWEKWTRVPYGLQCLATGKPKSWDETARVNLRDRVSQLSAHPKLSPLVCQGRVSVTIRNAFAHGNAEYNPVTGNAEFTDIVQKVLVPAQDIRTQAIDMALSNCAIWGGLAKVLSGP